MAFLILSSADMDELKQAFENGWQTVFDAENFPTNGESFDEALVEFGYKTPTEEQLYSIAGFAAKKAARPGPETIKTTVFKYGVEAALGAVFSPNSHPPMGAHQEEKLNHWAALAVSLLSTEIVRDTFKKKGGAVNE